MRLATRALLLLAAIAAAIPAAADVRYESETQTKFSGMLGTVMKFGGGSKPQLSTVSLQRDAMRTDNDKRSQIIDLDKGAFIDIDHDKKQYTVMTFEELRQKMEAALKEAKQEAAQEPAAKPSDVKVKFKAQVETLGKTQNIDGHTAEGMRIKLTIEGQDSTGAQGTMLTTSETWLAKDVAGYDEIQAFYKRAAAKWGREWEGAARGWAALAAANPQLAEAMKELQSQSRQLEGTPLLTTTTVDVVGQPAPQPGEQATEKPAEAGEKDTESIPLDVKSAKGMLGRLGKKKTQEKAKEQQEAQAKEKAAKGEPAHLMTSTTRNRNFSTGSLAGDLFAPPAGYKEVKPKD